MCHKKATATLVRRDSEHEEDATKLIVISDDGKDLDDELAKVLCSSLCRRRQADVMAYVANLAPASMRARLSKGTLLSFFELQVRTVFSNFI